MNRRLGCALFDDMHIKLTIIMMSSMTFFFGLIAWWAYISLGNPLWFLIVGISGVMFVVFEAGERYVGY